MKWVYLFWTRLLTGPSPWMVFSCFEIILICLHTFIIYRYTMDRPGQWQTQTWSWKFSNYAVCKENYFKIWHKNMLRYQTEQFYCSHKPPIISNMLCVKKTTFKFGIRIVLDCRYVNYLYFSKTPSIPSWKTSNY